MESAQATPTLKRKQTPVKKVVKKESRMPPGITHKRFSYQFIRKNYTTEIIKTAVARMVKRGEIIDAAPYLRKLRLPIHYENLIPSHAVANAILECEFVKREFAKQTPELSVEQKKHYKKLNNINLSDIKGALANMSSDSLVDNLSEIAKTRVERSSEESEDETDEKKKSIIPGYKSMNKDTLLRKIVTHDQWSEIVPFVIDFFRDAEAEREREAEAARKAAAKKAKVAATKTSSPSVATKRSTKA